MVIIITMMIIITTIMILIIIIITMILIMTIRNLVVGSPQTWMKSLASWGPGMIINN